MNAYGVPLWIAGIPRDAILDFGFERVPPLAHRPNGQINIDWTQVPTQLETVDNQLVIPLMVPVIPPGVTKVIRIDITIPTERIFKIRAAMNNGGFTKLMGEVETTLAGKRKINTRANGSTSELVLVARVASSALSPVKVMSSPKSSKRPIRRPSMVLSDKLLLMGSR